MSKSPARSALKLDLFADAARKDKIDSLGDPLQIIARRIDFDHLKQVIDELLPRGDSRRGGQTIDATLVPVPIQHFTEEDKAQLKQGSIPSDWSEAKRRQKDLDAPPTPRSTARATTATS